MSGLSQLHAILTRINDNALRTLQKTLKIIPSNIANLVLYTSQITSDTEPEQMKNTPLTKQPLKN